MHFEIFTCIYAITDVLHLPLCHKFYPHLKFQKFQNNINGFTCVLYWNITRGYNKPKYGTNVLSANGFTPNRFCLNFLCICIAINFRLGILKKNHTMSIVQYKIDQKSNYLCRIFYRNTIHSTFIFCNPNFLKEESFCLLSNSSSFLPKFSSGEDLKKCAETARGKIGTLL